MFQRARYVSRLIKTKQKRWTALLALSFSCVYICLKTLRQETRLCLVNKLADYQKLFPHTEARELELEKNEQMIYSFVC